MTSLAQRITAKDAHVVIIGVGYVGLPLAVEIAGVGFRVTGYDRSAEKAQSIAQGRSYIGDVPDSVLAPLVASGHLTATADPAVMASADVAIICVPTPLNKTKDPDNSYIMAAAEELAPRLRPDTLVILESTTFPGFTREVLAPHFEAAGHKIGETLFLAFSPERVDPGNPRFGVKNTPKVVGGMTPRCLEAVTALYGQVMERVIPVSSTDAAEMTKLLENTFRAVNIGLVNEVAIMCDKLGIDTWEVIGAASSKPFGFMPFYPGPGLGGHCIPIDPLYLSWKLKTVKYNARFIELASEVNSGMPDVVVERLARALNDRERSVKGSRVLVVGVAYKRDIDDVRESPALDVIELLQARGAKVAYHDRHVPVVRIGEHTLESVPLEDLGGYDAAVIVTDHRDVDYARLVRESRLVLDTRNATRELRRAPEARGKVVTL